MLFDLIENGDIKDILFYHLLEKSSSSDSYDISDLIKCIDFYRDDCFSTNSVIDNTSVVKGEKRKSNDLVAFLKDLNEEISFSVLFDSLYIGTQSHISITELSRLFKSKYKDIQVEKLIKFLHLLDTKSCGFVHYKQFHLFMREYVDLYSTPIILHSSYIANIVNIDFNGKWKDYLVYKNISIKSNLSKQEFLKNFKEEFFNDDTSLLQYFDFIKETKGKLANQVHMQNLVDFITQNTTSLSSAKRPDKYTSKLNNYEIEQQMLSFFKNIEKKTLARKFFNNIDTKNVNQYGFINQDHISNILRNKYKLEENFISNFVEYFKTSINTLVDLLKVHEFVLRNCESSYITTGEIITEIVDYINNLKIKSLDLFLNKYSLKTSHLFTLNDTCNYFSVMFEIEIFDCFCLFKELITDEDNPDKEEFKFTLEYFLTHFQLINLFDPIKKDKKQLRTNPLLVQTLAIIHDYFIGLKDTSSIMELFNKLDTNENGTLSREEFLQFLNSLKLGINDSQKLLILDYADANNSDSIDYIEFMELIVEMKTNSPKKPKLESPPRNKKLPKAETMNMRNNKIRDLMKSKYSTLKDNYEYNLKNLDPKATFEYNTFQLQRDLYLRFNEENNMLTELESFAQDPSVPFVIYQDDFFSYLGEKSKLSI